VLLAEDVEDASLDVWGVYAAGPLGVDASAVLELASEEVLEVRYTVLCTVRVVRLLELAFALDEKPADADELGV
jgi:hypothetical protein